MQKTIYNLKINNLSSEKSEELQIIYAKKPWVSFLHHGFLLF